MAADLNLPDPIHPNFAATTECYHTAFTEALSNAKNNGKTKTHVFVASHNENTVEFAVKTYVRIQKHVLSLHEYHFQNGRNECQT